MKPDNLNVGDVFYECQYGINIKVEVITRPKYTLEDNRRHWVWIGKNVCDGSIINYALTEGLDHYGPRIYSEPQYCHFIDGEIVFKFLGEG